MLCDQASSNVGLTYPWTSAPGGTQGMSPLSWAWKLCSREGARADLRGELDGTREVGHRLLGAALRQVHVAHVGVGAGALGLVLEHYLEEALRLLPPLLCRCLHPCQRKPSPDQA